MSELGKIFIFEKDANNLKQYSDKFELNGFSIFGTNNLYLLTQYVKELKPDIVIINLPQTLHLDDKTFEDIENKLCIKDKCPDIYINTHWGFKHNNNFHYWNFVSDDLGYEQILSIISHSNSKHYTH